MFHFPTPPMPRRNRPKTPMSLYSFWLLPEPSSQLPLPLLLLLLGAGPIGLAFFLWDKALKLGDPRQIGALSYLTPLLSTLLLVASGRGQLGPTTGAAIALIVGGALACTLDWRMLRRKPA